VPKTEQLILEAEEVLAELLWEAVEEVEEAQEA
jgi:hypothetical protein